MSVVELAREMVRTPSVTGDEAELAAKLVDRLETTDAEVTTQPVDGFGPNVVARSPGDGPTVLLNGHLDTVPVQGAWSKDPLGAEVESKRVHGLGAVDMKGGDACIIDAFETVHRDVDLDLWLTLTVDEEGHCAGAYRFFEEHNPDPDLVLIPESTDESVVLGARGRVAFELTVHGDPGHGARPDDNINAIGEAAKVLRALDDLPMAGHPTLPDPSATPLQVAGGNYSLSVPGECVVVLDRHLVPPETPESAKQDIEDRIADVDLEVGADVAFADRPTPFLEPYELSGSEPLVAGLLKFHEDHFHAEADISYGQSVGDFNVFAQHAPTVVYGPEGGNLHEGDEWVSIASLERVAGFYRGFLREVGGG